MSTNNATVKEHPLAHILRAIADGVPVQAKWDSETDWWDFRTHVHSLALDTSIGIQYRIKPKPKVKKWRWVYTGDPSDEWLGASGGHYSSAEEFYEQTGFTAVQKIDSTMIEVEE